jgi:DNA repair exonuclease SbcCD ATPase subunit
MKILNVEIHNFKNINDIAVPLDGASVYLVGPNQSGKTSFIQGIFAALTGKEIPAEAITRGEHKASIQVTVGDAEQNVEVLFEMKHGKRGINRQLSIRANGEPITAAPRTWLNDFLGDFTFDVDSLFTQQREKLMQTIAQSLGIDEETFNTQLNERIETRRQERNIFDTKETILEEYVSNGVRSNVYQPLGYSTLNEALHNFKDADWQADLTEAQAQLDKHNTALALLPDPAAEAARLKSEWSAEYDRRMSLYKEHEERRTIQLQTLQDKMNEEAAIGSEIAQLEQRIADLRKRANSVQNRIHEIKQKTAETDKALAEEMDDIKAWYAETKEKVDAVEARTKDDTERADLTYQVERTRETIAMCRHGQTFSNWLQQYQSYLDAYKAAEKSYHAAEASVQELRDQRAANVEAAIKRLGVDGLAYNRETQEFTYQGFELDPEQVNTALLMELALRLTVLRMGKLRLIRVYNAALLDANVRDRLVRFATEHDYQLFLEIPETTDSGGLEIRMIEQGEP